MSFTMCFKAHVERSFIQSRVSQRGEPHPILICEVWSLYRMPLLYENHDTVTCYQLICLPVECSQQGFLEHSTTCPVCCFKQKSTYC